MKPTVVLCSTPDADAHGAFCCYMKRVLLGASVIMQPRPLGVEGPRCNGGIGREGKTGGGGVEGEGSGQ